MGRTFWKRKSLRGGMGAWVAWELGELKVFWHKPFLITRILCWHPTLSCLGQPLLSVPSPTKWSSPCSFSPHPQVGSSTPHSGCSPSAPHLWGDTCVEGSPSLLLCVCLATVGAPQACPSVYVMTSVNVSPVRRWTNKGTGQCANQGTSLRWSCLHEYVEDFLTYQSMSL